MTDDKNFFDQQINNTFKTYENIRKIATGQGNDYTTACLLDYSYFNKNYKMISIDWVNSKLLMLIQEQFNEFLILQEIKIEMELRQCSLLLKKQKKLFWTIYKEP